MWVSTDVVLGACAVSKKAGQVCCAMWGPRSSALTKSDGPVHQRKRQSSCMINTQNHNYQANYRWMLPFQQLSPPEGWGCNVTTLGHVPKHFYLHLGAYKVGHSNVVVDMLDQTWWERNRGKGIWLNLVLSILPAKATWKTCGKALLSLANTLLLLVFKLSVSCRYDFCTSVSKQWDWWAQVKNLSLVSIPQACRLP